MNEPQPLYVKWRVPLLALVGLTLIAGCNSVFGIHEGTPRLLCADGLMIDDMEDGDGSICHTNGRTGVWFDFGDGSPTGDLTPKSDTPFTPTRIEDGSRGSSRYAARFAGSGFTAFGAFMGFSLMNSPRSYDAGGLGGITFWMKSNVPVSIDFPTSDTTPLKDGGDCLDDCNHHFTFQVTAPAPGWLPYQVPFNALSGGGAATWNPRHLFGVNFRVPPGAAFEVWIDDVAFYQCAGPECQPTCTDLRFPVSCRIGNGLRSSCTPSGTDCSAVATWCGDPLLIDDMEDADAEICQSAKRDGNWYVVDDGTSTDLMPADSAPFVQTEIPGGRGTSHRAARLTGSGFTAWGAQMGFSLNTYDASQVSGIKFWMRSDAPVVVGLPIPTTVPASEEVGGECQGSENCDFHFAFEVGASSNEWVERLVPFAALRQTEPFHGNGNLIPGSAQWDPSRLLGIYFGSHSSAFDIWIDDIRFYTCQMESCVPTCPAETVACPAHGGRPADCWPVGTDCSTPPELVSLWGVWGSGPSDVWTVGYKPATLAGVLFHWNGATWSTDTSSATSPMFDVWGTSPTDIWAMGDRGTILHGSGSAWLATASGTTSTFNGIWGSGPSDVWAIEFPGTIRHWDGTAWSTSISAAGQLRLAAIWGSSPNDVWAVGDNGTILHGDGSSWSSTTTGGGQRLWGVWGTSAHDVWAVGGAGAIVHWDGSAWVVFPGDTGLSLRGVWGAEPNDVWAVGESGTIVHWDGLSWLAFPSGTKQRLYAVWGSGAHDVWAVGYANTILHWDGAIWSPSSP